MKMKQRLLAVLLTITMTIAPATGSAAVSVAIITAEAAAETCVPGDTLHITFSIAGNPGFWGAGFTIEYNADALTLIGIENGAKFTGGSVTSNLANGTLAFYGDSLTSNITGDGELFTAEFVVNPGVARGSYRVTANVRADDAKNFVDFNGNAVTVAFSGCVIRVEIGSIQHEYEIIVTVDVPSTTEIFTDPDTGKVTAVVREL